MLFSSSIQKDTNVIFIAKIGLNNGKDIFINGKLLRGMGVIYISEIEDWGKIKTKLHWINVLLTDSNYTIAAKYFIFGFETTDLHNLHNFQYSLIDNQGKLIKFKQGEDKIPALNFSIQIVK